jgi:hypothetical protein
MKKISEEELTKFNNENPTALLLKREYLPNVTKGTLKGFINHVQMVDINTIELKWKDNEKSISCIPEGIYDIEPDTWFKYNKKVLGIKNVPNRDRILLHPGNFAYGKQKQLDGCIAPVLGYADLDKDGTIDGTNSQKAFEILMHIFGNIRCKILIYS